MTKWVVRRWARYGHDRLYVATPGGTSLGYLDLKTGRYHAEQWANLGMLKAAIAEHRGWRDRAMAISGPVQNVSYPPAPNPLTSYPPRASPPAMYPPIADPLGFYPPPAVPGPHRARAAHPAPALLPGRPPAWQDLSTNQPGAAAREQALAERKAQGWLQHWLGRLVGARTSERAWRIGADGEQAVAQQLALLDGQWRVLHAVPVGERGADIDHVVIGPAGVFTVNAKNHPNAYVWVGGNTFMVNGQRVPYIRNSRHEARRASHLLSGQVGFPVDAVGVIAVVGAHRGLTVKQQPHGRVTIVSRRRIRQYLEGLPTRFNAREVDAVFEAARRSTTWRP